MLDILLLVLKVNFLFCFNFEDFVQVVTECEEKLP